MVKCRRRLGFVKESGLDFFVSKLFRREQLKGHCALQSRVLGLVDRAHATAFEFFDDPVVGNDLSDHAIRIVSNGIADTSGIASTDS